MLLFKLDFRFSSEWNCGTAARKRDGQRDAKFDLSGVANCRGSRLRTGARMGTLTAKRASLFD